MKIGEQATVLEWNFTHFYFLINNLFCQNMAIYNLIEW